MARKVVDRSAGPVTGSRATRCRRWGSSTALGQITNAYSNSTCRATTVACWFWTGGERFCR